MKIPRFLSFFASVWTVGFWLAAVAFPIFTLLARVEHGAALLDPLILHVAGITVFQALLSVVLSAVIGLPLGLWMGARQGSGSRLAQMALALPFGVPAVVAGLAWVMILGRSGLLHQWGFSLDWAYSLRAVILAHVVFNIPWIALWVAQSRTFLPRARLEAARTLGAGRWARFRRIIWPHLRWAFLSGTCQTWIFCTMSFALILVLGGGPPVQTLETALFSRIRFGTLDIPGAVVCAFWELLITLIPWSLLVFFQARSEEHRVSPERLGAPLETRSGGWFRVVVAGTFFLPYAIVLANLRGAMSVVRENAWPEIMSAAKVSTVLAVSTSFGAVITAVLSVVAVQSLPSRARTARAVSAMFIGLPSGLSALVLGLGFWLAYGRWIDPFSGSLLAMIVLQVALFFPVAFRIFWPVARETRHRQLEAALTLGASPLRAFWAVEWPRWRLPILSALGMIAGASLGEVAAVSLFYSENLVPLPLLISRWMFQYRFMEAQAVAALLLIFSSGTIALAFKWRAS